MKRSKRGRLDARSVGSGVGRDSMDTISWEAGSAAGSRFSSQKRLEEEGRNVSSQAAAHIMEPEQLGPPEDDDQQQPELEDEDAEDEEEQPPSWGERACLASSVLKARTQVKSCSISAAIRTKFQISKHCPHEVPHQLSLQTLAPAQATEPLACTLSQKLLITQLSLRVKRSLLPLNMRRPAMLEGGAALL